jgi:hypothetical protein
VALNVTGIRPTVSTNVRTIETASVASTIVSVGGEEIIPPRLLVICLPCNATPRSMPMEQRTVDSSAERVPEPLSLPISSPLLFQPKTKVITPARRSGRDSSIAFRD